MPSDVRSTPRVRLAWICLGVWLAWRVGVSLVGIGNELWFSVPAEARLGRFTHAFTDPIDERFRRGWAYGESRRGLEVGRAHDLFVALHEHVPETGIVALVVAPEDQFLGHLRGALYPRKVLLSDRLHAPVDAPRELYLVTFREADAVVAARWFEPLEPGDFGEPLPHADTSGKGWRLWKLREVPR